MKDEQKVMDDEEKALRYDRIVRCQCARLDAVDAVRAARAALRDAERRAEEAKWALDLAMSGVR